MKKYRGILLSASVAAMLLGSCSVVYAEETEVATEATSEVATESVEEAVVDAVEEGEISASDRAALESYAEQAITMVTGYSEEEMEEIVNPSSILSQTPESVVNAVQSWKGVKDELGSFVEIKSYDIDVDDDIKVDSLAVFENGENVVSLTISGKDFTMESLTFETAKQTMGQKMKEAVLNTIMGVCIVFCMLLFLSALISQFKHISKLEEAFAKKKAAPAPATPVKAAPAAAPVVEKEVVDDGELIAVIAAAIAAAEGTSTDGFVVRSIKKSNRNKWQRA